MMGTDSEGTMSDGVELERKRLLSVSDIRGKLSLWIFSFYYDSIQGFYTML
jgi:hypothetical protein